LAAFSGPGAPESSTEVAGATVTTPSSTTTASTSTTTTVATTTTTLPSTAEPLVAPSQIRVLVLNAMGVTGLAATVTNQLEDLGYRTEEPANYSPRQQQSKIWYQTGFAEEALELAAHFPDADVEENTTLRTDADLVVVLGASYGS
jgi:hypothetical protein